MRTYFRWLFPGVMLVLETCVVPARNLGKGTAVTLGGFASKPIKPPADPSDEANAFELQLAHEQGIAADTALGFWLTHGASSSGRMGAGEYEIAYSLRKPEGGWRAAPNELQWQTPFGNVLLAIVILDGADQRPVPGLKVRAELTRSNGEVVADEVLPYRWDAPLEEYAAPLTLPSDVLRLRVWIDPPRYWRHDPINGDRFASTTFAEFARVPVDPQAIASLADPDQATALTLARVQGDALRRAFVEMSRSVANDGAEVEIGDYRLACAVEFAETYWEFQDGNLTYNLRSELSTETNAHVEIAVFDALTGRFVPGLDVKATLVTADGQVVGTEQQPFMWHPWIHHYGRNWRIPGSGRYRIRVHADAPSWMRGGKELGRRFAHAIDFEFAGIELFTGQK